MTLSHPGELPKLPFLNNIALGDSTSIYEMSGTQAFSLCMPLFMGTV